MKHGCTLVSILLFTITIGTCNAGWTVRYQHLDVLGSVIAESNMYGEVSQRFDYKPFGEGTPSQKSGLGYTGHLEDSDLNLTYMQQRYYDPVVGRFYSNDPVGFRHTSTMTFNRYAYGNNNPYRYIDPDGLASKSFEECEHDANCSNLIGSHGDISGTSYRPYGHHFPRIVWPAHSKVINSTFSKKRRIPELNLNRPHKGIDIRQPKGGKTMSVEYGIVSEVGPSGSGENIIKVENSSGSTSIYRHQAATVEVGAHVSAGQGDGSGHLSGPHLHYEYIPQSASEPVDPLTTQLKDVYENP